jgi:hypothetical protein
MQITAAPQASTALEFGIYRDGENNLDRVQAPVIDQAIRTSATDPSIRFNVEDTTHRLDENAPSGVWRSERYTIQDGTTSKVQLAPPDDMASRKALGAFVARTLDDAQAVGAKQTWIDLVDHGGGDGGGLENALNGNLMSADDMAGAIADGIHMHGDAHPDDRDRTVDGVVANQCLMSTLGFASSLSHAGVAFLAASPEVMLAPGVPSTVAHAIAQNGDDPKAMAKAVVATTMKQKYGLGDQSYGAAAAFNVLDLAPEKIATMESAVRSLNDTIATSAKADPNVRSAIRADVKSEDGMSRFDDTNMPWHADRPALAVYGKLAADAQLPDALRQAASNAKAAVGDLILAHSESRAFGPYDDASYKDAVGPTTHLPTSKAEVDPWAPQVSETSTAFFKTTHGSRLDSALA